MKKLIDNSGGYETYAEIKEFTNPSHAGWKTLSLTTVWNGARSKVEEHRQYEINLDPESFERLKEFFREV